MILSTAIRLLASPQFAQNFADYVNELLVTFAEQTKQICGPSFLVYNVHCLIHFAGDVKKFGNLDQFSAFPFENKLKSIDRKSVV